MSQKLQSAEYYGLSQEEHAFLEEAVVRHGIKAEKIFGDHYRPDWAREDPPRDEEGRSMSVFQVADEKHPFIITIFYNQHGSKSELEWADELKGC